MVRTIAGNHPEVELLVSFNASMPDEALLARETVSSFIDSANIRVWHGAVRGGEATEGYTLERRLSELAIAHHVNCLAPDVALSTSPFEGEGNLAAPLLPGCGCNVPVASIFYDAIPARFKETYLTHGGLSNYYHRRLKAYSGFADNLCISEFSKSELQSFHPSAKATNISAGISHDFIRIRECDSGALVNLGAFVLYVGALDWRKNVTAIIGAFRLIDQVWPENGLKLVLAGDGPAELLNEIVASWKNLGLNPARLICLGYVSDEQLVSLYSQARVLVQPSFMEGFGLTALEAIYCGALVVAARAGALPEVVGTEELLFDPAKPQEIADLVVRLLRDTGRTDALLKGLQKHAAQFTWKRSAAAAVERLAFLAKGNERIGIASSRKRIAKILNGSLIDRELAVRSLAISEPISSPPRLLIDATSTVRIDHKTGIQRVVRKICAALADRPLGTTAERMFIVCDDSLGWFEVDGRKLDRPQKEQQRPLTVLGDTLLMLDSSWEFHALYRKDWRACRLRGGEVIFCLYDFVPLRMQAMCNPAVPLVFSEWFKAALVWSTGFVCISRAVADELLALLEAIEFPRRLKIGYWQLGADFLGTIEALPAEHDSSPHRPHFLMVGTLEPRKGYRIALDAFEKLWAEGVDAALTIVGKTGWGIDHLIERIKHHAELGKRLVWHESMDDAELSRLYASCNALIAASFAEGFGLPIVEAGHFGKPVLASDIPVFREVGTGAAEAHFFQVGDCTALAKAVKDFLKAHPRSPTVAAHPTWPNWGESAAQLENVVIGQNWYRTYEPQVKSPFTPLSELGQTRMAVPLSEADRAHRLTLVEGPHLADEGANLRIIVGVTNLSEAVWSSHGPVDDSLGVALGFHLLDSAGKDIGLDNQRTRIPFVLIPGETNYMAVTVSADWRAQGAAFADIELVQDAIWFGGALRVAL
ncbi:glycosyltransferase family 1 protein [Bradyrhizobium sp. S69]|uniref:glycosyltransferase family 4 protein n=1 Tax=Bradyrhizobium sp. S69 TaxID=1641856 RepID=UPI001AED691B|nr:glycosyltransferase family 1 protein [Bradyrhizobium sp. S69]